MLSASAPRRPTFRAIHAPGIRKPFLPARWPAGPPPAGVLARGQAVVAYDRGCGYRGSIYVGMPHIPSTINLHLDVPGLSNATGAAFMYLWEAGTPR